MFHPASPLSVAMFLLVCGFVLAALLRGVWLGARALGRRPAACTLGTAVGVVIWLALAGSLVASGWIEAVPARLMVFGAGSMLISVAVGLSPVGKWLAANPLAWLLAFQGFRLPLELVLHAWVKQGVIPQTMTWIGANWDVLSGIVALVLAPFCARSKAAAWAGNVIGFVLLVNVARVAVLSSPGPFGWPDVSPKLQVAYHLPYALIIPVCVGGALIGHIALTRALLKSRA